MEDELASLLVVCIINPGTVTQLLERDDYRLDC